MALFKAMLRYTGAENAPHLDGLMVSGVSEVDAHAYIAFKNHAEGPKPGQAYVADAGDLIVIPPDFKDMPSPQAEAPTASPTTDTGAAADSGASQAVSVSSKAKTKAGA